MLMLYTNQLYCVSLVIMLILLCSTYWRCKYHGVGLKSHRDKSSWFWSPRWSIYAQESAETKIPLWEKWQGVCIICMCCVKCLWIYCVCMCEHGVCARVYAYMCESVSVCPCVLCVCFVCIYECMRTHGVCVCVSVSFVTVLPFYMYYFL